MRRPSARSDLASAASRGKSNSILFFSDLLQAPEVEGRPDEARSDASFDSPEGLDNSDLEDLGFESEEDPWGHESEFKPAVQTVVGKGLPAKSGDPSSGQVSDPLGKVPPGPQVEQPPSGTVIIAPSPPPAPP